jgi:hypothetical protein
MNISEFELLMEQIDQILKDNGIPIPSRPLRAVRDVSIRLKTEIIVAPEPVPPIPGRYDRLTLAAHINSWYQTRYGDRLKIHFGPGSVALLIRGDPWKMVLPRILGSVNCNCDPDLEKDRKAPRIMRSPQRLNYNVLCCIEDFPAGLASSLTENERLEILQFFVKAHESLQSIETISDKPYVGEAIADLQSASASILARPPQYGLSKWSSLQFVEKLLKSFLELKKAPIPKHHNVEKIAQFAKAYGLALSDAALLASVQCTAGVRYGEVQVTLDEAVSAHHVSLDLGRQLAEQIKGA